MEEHPDLVERRRVLEECKLSPEELAVFVMKKADKMGRNERLSTLEMDTFLKDHKMDLLRHFYKFSVSGPPLHIQRHH